MTFPATEGLSFDLLQ